MNVRQQTMGNRPQTKNNISAGNGHARFSNKITRRMFLNVFGKSVAAAILLCIVPIRLMCVESRKIVMRIKKFKIRDIYKKHNLAG